LEIWKPLWSYGTFAISSLSPRRASLTLAAEKRLHTAQPSLSRQIRDLEYEVGVQLMSRSVHGIELTAAGRAAIPTGPQLGPQEGGGRGRPC
jgi:DNA-binding transcriptional LysR family regulator